MSNEATGSPTETEEDIKSPEQIAQEEAAAVKLQSIARGHEQREKYLDQKHAAEEIQRVTRGKQSRENSISNKEEIAAATKIQARIRQKEAKTRVTLLREEKKLAEAEAEAKSAEAAELTAKNDKEKEVAAATKIQARIRQKEAKAKVTQLKQDRKEQEKAALKIENKFRQKQAKKEVDTRRKQRNQQQQQQQQEKEEAAEEEERRRQQSQQSPKSQQSNMQDTEEDQNWLDEELQQSGITGHLPDNVDGHFHRGAGKQKHKNKHNHKSKQEKQGLAFGKKLDEGGRDTYVDQAYGGGDTDHAYNAKHHHVVGNNEDGKEVDYIRHAKQKKIKKREDVHKYDPQMFEKVFELIEGVVESNRNAKDGFGARTIFGEHTSSILDVFVALDRDKDGTVTHEEFKRGMHRLGIGLTDKQITAMLKHMDKDDSGEIEYNEFITMFTEAHVEHKRVQKMLHHHKKSDSTASHNVRTHKTEDERRKKKHQDLVMKRAGMSNQMERGGGDSKEFSTNKKNNSMQQRADKRAHFSNNSNSAKQRNANGISNDRPTNSPGWRDQGKSKLPKYGSPGVDPDLLFDDSDPFFRDALDTLSTVPKQRKSPNRRGKGSNNPINMDNDPSSTAQIISKAPWVAFVIGGPGSSAHKICAEMARMHGYTHLSAEKAIRDEVASGSSCGKGIIHAISQGRVPVDLTIEVIMRNILKSSGTRVLVEGFPQDIEQAQGFEEAIGAVQGVVYVKCSRREMQRRILEAAGKDSGDIDSVATVRDARRQISEFEDKVAEVLTYYSLGNKIFVIKDGPSLLKMCNQTDSYLGRFPAPSRSFGTQTDSGLVSEDTANNMPTSLNDWSEMREKPSPFFNGENTAVASGFVRGGNNGQAVNVPTPPKRRGLKGTGPRTEKIQQNQQVVMDGPRSELEKWFQSINIMAGPVPQWRTNFANGFLYAQILEIFFPSELQSVGFHTGVSSSNKRDNWRQLQTFFLRYDFPLSDAEIMSMMQAKKSAIVPMLLKFHTFLVGQG